jgi:5-methylthioadenosine/S-adenosylhomocysteine deaminase
MATHNGAKVLGLSDIIGTLTPGKKADIVIAQLNQPHLSPIYDIYSHITYCMRPSDIDMVMVNGKVVIEDGNLVTADENEILSKARAWQEKIREH